ncbi:MAG TPA: hypothetical protein VGM51_16270 [Armatimonadota bacterium]|jgi:mono/diheme cytochrome c family protein
MKHPAAYIFALAFAASTGAAFADAPKQPDNLPKELLKPFKTWSVRCAQCHNPERVYGTKYTDPKQIEVLIARMARKTTTISKDDQKLIVAYVTWHNKPAK